MFQVKVYYNVLLKECTTQTIAIAIFMRKTTIMDLFSSSERLTSPRLFMMLVMMAIHSSGQNCTPGMITEGPVIPNTNLPTQGLNILF